MRGLAALLTLALACGVCKPDSHTTKHFQTVYSWSGIDYVFPDEEARSHALEDKSFVPGKAVPWGFDVDPESGRMFMAFVKTKTGVPASLTTVSPTTNAKGEHFLEPYPDWSWHTKGCDGITSVEKIAVDECGRLWVMDTGNAYSDGLHVMPTQLCPPQLLVFDLKTNQLIKKHKFPESFVNDDSAFSTVVVDVVSKEHDCKDTFVYVADSGAYTLTVYDFAHDDLWFMTTNNMYPYPQYGNFSVKDVHFDYMYGIYSMALSPKDGTGERTLFYNSMASAVESHVKTSVLHHKEKFEGYNHVTSDFMTFLHPRPGGQTGSEVMDDHGIMFFNSINDMTVFCWNHKADYSEEHFAEVDRDDEAFQVFGDMKIVKKDEESYLYILTNSYQKFLFGHPTQDHVLFRVMKAPVHSLVEGTVCMRDGSHRK